MSGRRKKRKDREGKIKLEKVHKVVQFMFKTCLSIFSILI